MPKIHGYPTSRDYDLPTIPCKQRQCACNKNGMCEVPSMISIGADGACETGKKYDPKTKAKA